jgi:hypothetical protein
VQAPDRVDLDVWDFALEQMLDGDPDPRKFDVV